MMDYAANGGTATQQSIQFDYPQKCWHDTQMTGIIQHNAQGGCIRIPQVIDGLSNTLMIGEKSFDQAFYGQIKADDNEGYSIGYDQDVVRWGTYSLFKTLPQKNGGAGKGLAQFIQEVSYRHLLMEVSSQSTTPSASRRFPTCAQ
jgi:hypothetical protein